MRVCFYLIFTFLIFLIKLYFLNLFRKQTLHSTARWSFFLWLNILLYLTALHRSLWWNKHGLQAFTRVFPYIFLALWFFRNSNAADFLIFWSRKIEFSGNEIEIVGSPWGPGRAWQTSLAGVDGADWNMITVGLLQTGRHWFHIMQNNVQLDFASNCFHDHAFAGNGSLLNINMSRITVESGTVVGCIQSKNTDSDVVQDCR